MRRDVSNTALILSLLEDTVDFKTLEKACLALARELIMEENQKLYYKVAQIFKERMKYLKKT